MTARAKAQYKKYLQAREEAHARFVIGLKKLTPKQKTDILIKAGVLTKQGKFTARYRTSSKQRVVAR